MAAPSVWKAVTDQELHLSSNLAVTENRSSILLAEDDFHLGMLLKDYLELEGYNVTLCRDGDLAWQECQQQRFDLCLLDVMLPKQDGFTLAASIRKAFHELPIIFITARSLKEDKLKGYGLGADDYIIKPFDEQELLWKIRALMRRMLPKDQHASVNIIPLGKYLFDPVNHALHFAGQTRRITEKECEILSYLSNHRNMVIRRETMLQELWGVNDYFIGRSLDVFITKIRKYLKEDPALGIENVFGVGFVFNVPE